MKCWKIKNNLIVFKPSDEEIYFNAKDLYKITEKFIYKNKDYESPFSVLNIRKSILGLNVLLEIKYETDGILLDLYAIKKGEKYKISINNGVFADYVIIDGVWHYLSTNYNEYIEIIKNENIKTNEKLSFNQYMKLIRELNKQGYEYIDNVNSKINLLKNQESKFNVDGLNATLFNYQEKGCKWLEFMMNNNCGCILGDEMGLGKTLQIIALLGKEKENNPNAHFLVICPVSLLENWKREIEKFFPSLKTYVHHGSRRTGLYDCLLQYDVIIMSYSNVQSDLSMLNMIKWDIIILDEAQNIKNPYAKRSKNIKLLNRKTAIAVTGTPFENHMTDIWSIVDFVLPTYLGKISEYEEEFMDNTESAYRLEKIITPIMLRRKVNDVAKDLPERVNIPQPIEMTEQEAMLYEGERKNSAISELKNTSMEKIQGLRMFCTHPMVYDNTLVDIDPITCSNKYSRLCEILQEVFENREKAIIFTSFNKMIEIIVKDIKKRFNVYTNFINGSIFAGDRQKVIDEFSSIEGPGILVLNPKAAGAGLNITCANHVIHYNLEWNPAIEDQASARAYRRGQEKTVFVYRLYYANTIEEVINEKIQTKRDISNIAVIGNQGTEKDKEDLIKALSISPLGGNYGNS